MDEDVYVTLNHSAAVMNVSEDSPLSGYDLPLYGLDNGQFLLLHVPAVVCTIISFCCALTVIIVSFQQNGVRTFFRWNKGERLVVYLELCDAAFNFSTLMSRLHILSTRDHVRPPWLCIIYACILADSLVSQALMVNAVAINAFFMMYRGRDISFGKWDHRLLVYTFGVPFCLVVYVAASDQFGPSGIVCTIDAVHSDIAAILTSGILIIVFFSNTVLYLLTWTKISRQAREIKDRLSSSTSTTKKVSKAAKTMTMFVLAFFVQWLPTVVYSIWKVIENQPPILLMKFLASFSNLGGILNGAVYVIIRWQKLKPVKKSATNMENLAFSSSQNNTDCNTPATSDSRVTNLNQKCSDIMRKTLKDQEEEKHTDILLPKDQV